jgi:hypothetical protein
MIVAIDTKDLAKVYCDWYQMPEDQLEVIEQAILESLKKISSERKQNATN